MSRPRFSFCFTLDTEPDDLWANRPTLSFEHFKRLVAFHRRIANAGARPTYLTTSEVAEDPAARNAMLECLKQENCEIGAHFHTWTREWPFPVPQLDRRDLHVMAHQLGAEIETAMLEYTCEALEKAFGSRPRCYRGRRFSFGPSTLNALKRCGVRIDSTYTPGIDWRDSQHPLLDGTDFRNVRRDPHFLSDDGAQSVLEIPMGAAWLPPFTARMGPFMQKQARRVGKLIGMPLGHRWLRPTYVSTGDLVATLKQMKSDNIPVWVLVIHSSEIAPCTPLPTEEKVNALIERCLAAIEAAVELGAKPATLSEAAEPYLATRAAPVQAHA
jgi:hypothetical protein